MFAPARSMLQHSCATSVLAAAAGDDRARSRRTRWLRGWTRLRAAVRRNRSNPSCGEMQRKRTAQRQRTTLQCVPGLACVSRASIPSLVAPMLTIPSVLVASPAGKLMQRILALIAFIIAFALYLGPAHAQVTVSQAWVR